MIYKVTRPDKVLHTAVKLPASKSISNRLLIINALSGNPEFPENLSDSDDTRVMIEALSGTSSLKDVGHAGTSMRFLTAYFSTRKGTVRLTGSERMKQRPVGPLVEALDQLGAEINYVLNEGFPPLDIEGKPLTGGEISVDAGISSQFISALLMIAPTMKNGLIMHLEGEMVSGSYIRMTLELMQQWGAETDWTGNTITIQPTGYRSGTSVVESDWSGASYWYAMTLLQDHARISLSYLGKESLQGDQVLTDIFHSLGVVSEFDGGEVTLYRLTKIHPGMFSFDFTNAPDIVQSMAVALCISAVPFRFTGTKTLRIKETDRIQALQTELKKLGFILETDDEGSFLEWNKVRCTPEQEPVIETYHDHRMAMAFAPAALAVGEIRIKDPMVVTKSYPHFWEHLGKAGFSVVHA